MRGAGGRFKRILTHSSREQQGAGRFKLPRRSADALAAAEARGECTAVKQPRKPQPGKAHNEFNKGLWLAYRLSPAVLESADTLLYNSITTCADRPWGGGGRAVPVHVEQRCKDHPSQRRRGPGGAAGGQERL